MAPELKQEVDSESRDERQKELMCTCTINEEEFEIRGDTVRGAKMEKVTREKARETKERNHTVVKYREEAQ